MRAVIFMMLEKIIKTQQFAGNGQNTRNKHTLFVAGEKRTTHAQIKKTKENK